MSNGGRFGDYWRRQPASEDASHHSNAPYTPLLRRIVNCRQLAFSEVRRLPHAGTWFIPSPCIDHKPYKPGERRRFEGFFSLPVTTMGRVVLFPTNPSDHHSSFELRATSCRGT
jgi:hypothetical protein